jgi:pimeloyl-ACP methyl ester carboxylesterase
MWTHSHTVEATGTSAPSVYLVRRIFLASVLVLTGLTACSNSDGTPADVTAPESPSIGGSIKWKDCDDDALVKCARFEVPFDYNNPDVGTFSLKLTMNPARDPKKRIGAMLVNPGGPGFGGSYLAESAESFFGGDLVDAFDIIGWDPRGTGESTPAVDCVDDYDPYFTYDPSPDDAAEKQIIIDASKNFVEECEKKNGDILPFISTNNSARDMDRIRAALGEEKITYFGFSYGSELGATWVTKFPSTVRAAVFDGATDPNADYVQSGLDQAKGFETELTKFLAQCSSTPDCAFHNKGNAEGAFDSLMEDLDANPLRSTPKRAAVNQGIALTAVAQAMYSSSLWSSLETALAAAQNGDGSLLLSMYDDYYQRSYDGTYGNQLEAFNAIMCLDDPGPKTIEGVDKYIPDFEKVAKRLGSSFSAGYVCTFWPTETDKRITITGKNAGPIVVIGTTGDAATPLQSSRNMTKTLEDGRLIVVTDNRHTGYGSNNCVIEAVNRYLLTTKISWTEKQC